MQSLKSPLMNAIMQAIAQLLYSGFSSIQQIQTKSLYLLRKNPIQRRSKATVEAVLEAGARLMLTIGYDKASTNKIAEKAGISIGSLYEYFPGKEAIFAEIRRRQDHRYARLVQAEPVPSTFRETLRLNIKTYIRLALSNIELHAALVRDVPKFATSEAESILIVDSLEQSNRTINCWICWSGTCCLSKGLWFLGSLPIFRNHLARETAGLYIASKCWRSIHLLVSLKFHLGVHLIQNFSQIPHNPAKPAYKGKPNQRRRHNEQSD